MCSLARLEDLTTAFMQTSSCAILHHAEFHLFPRGEQPLVDQDLLNIETSRSQSDTSHSVGLLWTSDQPVAETATWEYITRDRYPYTPVGFEPTIPAVERPQTHTLDRAVTAIGFWLIKSPKIWRFLYMYTHLPYNWTALLRTWRRKA
jgi:hypothetical protein